MTQSEKVYLADYQPYPWALQTVKLDFALYDDHTVVISDMHFVAKHPEQSTLYLYGCDSVELLEIRLNDEVLNPLDYQRDGVNLMILHCPNDFSLRIVTKITPQNNTQLSGLYRSNGLFCTQCEAEGFRRITFFPDRPDVLARYTTTISADLQQYPILLSNGNLIAKGFGLDGRHWVTWEDPFNKPSYLFALVAGNLSLVEDEYITMSGRKIRLCIYVEPENINQCSHAMSSLKKAMRWDEEVYGLEYDLDIFMIVAVSYFNMGAMENKGLNIFNSKYILALPEKATDQDYINIESVVAHEYFHNWTGNRVTCRDWFQLSLKEGLTVFRDQEFSRTYNSRDVMRINDVRALRQHQFVEDEGSMSHPVQPQSYQEINNFYTNTIYNKGAEVIRMIETLVGKSGFRRGMDLYFQRHDGCAVTIDDFVAAMADANQVDLTQFKRWYVQAGTPIVEVACQYQDGSLMINCRQILREQQLPLHIPIKIALFDNNSQMINESLLELRDMEQLFTIDGLTVQPIVSVLRDFSAPIKLYLLGEMDYVALLNCETDGFAQWEVSQKLALQAIHASYNDVSVDLGSLSDVYQQILLDEKRDYAMRAELLTLPSFEDCILDLSLVDVEKIADVRQKFKQYISQDLFSTAQQQYNKLWVAEDGLMYSEAYGRRGFRNICLELMMCADEQSSLSVCWHQLLNAKTMTDQLYSLQLLSHAKNQDVSRDALEYFFKRWSFDPLVVDRWFAVQALNPNIDTLLHVKELTQHELFDFKNPNRVRALIGTFSQMNPCCFHAVNGEGYEFLTECLLILDGINSQISARLATPFTQWKKFGIKHQEKIYGQLELLSQRKLSRDLREIVDQSIDK